MRYQRERRPGVPGVVPRCLARLSGGLTDGQGVSRPAELMQCEPCRGAACLIFSRTP